MKRIILICLGLMSFVFTYAQFPKTKQELQSYYENNITSLSPIEGKFTMHLTIVWSDEPYKKRSMPPRDYWIYYSKSERKYYVLFANSEDTNKIIKRFIIYQTGTNEYHMQDDRGNFLNFNNPNSFSFVDSHDYPEVISTFSFTKIYPTAEMYEQASTPQQWTGTGFALNDGYLITNYHVIDGAGSITIKGIKGDFNTKFKSNVVASDKANDIALLKIADARFSGFGTIPYQLRANVADVGEFVFTLGYPLASVMGDEIKYTDGRISSKTGIQGAVNVYQISVPIQPGNSGGPLFDQQGRIIGITTSSLNKELFDAENVNYAVKTGYILNLIDSSVGRNILPTGTTIKNLDLPSKIKSARNFVFLIECKK